MNKIYLVVIENGDETYFEAFSTHEKAKQYYDEELKKFKDNEYEMDCKDIDEEYYCTYDEGEYDDYHWSIYINELEVK